VIPVVINGFGKAFNKTGLRLRKKGTILSVQFKEPMNIDYNASSDDILVQIMDAIEQSKKFMPTGKHEVIVEEKIVNGQ
jgi:hypothetical protein